MEKEIIGRLLDKKVLKEEKIRILNLGCGDDFYGTDRLDIIKTKAVTLIHDLENSPLPFPDNTFEEVRCFGVFEHLRDNGHFVDEIWRVLKRGGELI